MNQQKYHAQSPFSPFSILLHILLEITFGSPGCACNYESLRGNQINQAISDLFFWSSCASWVMRLPQGTAGDLELQIGVQPSTVTAPRLIGILVGLISLNQNARIVVVTWYDIGISISQVWLFCNYLFRVSHDNTYETLTLRNASKMRNMCTNDLHGWR